jgi:hypothetical protein
MTAIVDKNDQSQIIQDYYGCGKCQINVVDMTLSSFCQDCIISIECKHCNHLTYNETDICKSCKIFEKLGCSTCDDCKSRFAEINTKYCKFCIIERSSCINSCKYCKSPICEKLTVCSRCDWTTRTYYNGDYL